MKTATTLGMAALLATAGAAVAEGPIALTNAQLDYVTASGGGGIFNTGTIVIIDSTVGSGGVSMTMGDGSVRFISGSISLSVSPSPGTSTRPAEFVIITIDQKTLEVPPAQR
jgi:hypothetical protein